MTLIDTRTSRRNFLVFSGALGQPGRECWRDIALITGPMLERVLAIGAPMRDYRVLTSGIPDPWSYQFEDIPPPRRSERGYSQ